MYVKLQPEASSSGKHKLSRYPTIIPTGVTSYAKHILPFLSCIPLLQNLLYILNFIRILL